FLGTTGLPYCHGFPPLAFLGYPNRAPDGGEGKQRRLPSTADYERTAKWAEGERELPIEWARTLAAIPSNAIAGEPRSMAASSPHTVAAAPNASANTPIVRNATR